MCHAICDSMIVHMIYSQFVMYENNIFVFNHYNLNLNQMMHLLFYSFLFHSLLWMNKIGKTVTPQIHASKTNYKRGSSSICVRKPHSNDLCYSANNMNVWKYTIEIIEISWQMLNHIMMQTLLLPRYPFHFKLWQAFHGKYLSHQKEMCTQLLWVYSVP